MRPGRGPAGTKRGWGCIGKKIQKLFASKSPKLPDFELISPIIKHQTTKILFVCLIRVNK